MRYFISILLLLFSHFALAQATSSLRYEGVLQGGAISTGTSSQNFTVTIDRPDCPSNALGLTAWTGNVTVVDGAFTLNPVFPADELTFALNPTSSFGAPCSPSTYSPRRLKITWNTAPVETFFVSLDDSPKANFSNVAANSIAIGGVSVQPGMSCSSGNLLKYNSGLLRFECQPLAASDIPALSASVISSGTFASAQLPNIAGDVTGSYGASVVERIRGINILATAPTANQVLKYNGTAWAPAADDAGTAVGDATYAAKGVVQVDTSAAFSGLQLNTGILSLATLHSGGTAGTATEIPVITYDNKGRITGHTVIAPSDTTRLSLAGGTMAGALNMGAQQITNAASVSAGSASIRDLILNDADSSNNVTIRTPASLSPNYTLTLPPDDGSSGQVLSTDGAGILSWMTPAVGGTGDVNQNGNSFGADMRVGTNDAFDLFLETDNLTRIQIRNSGEVGIGTTPSTGSALDLMGVLNMRYLSTPALSAVGQGRIYFDATTNRFRVSQNGGAYTDLINPGSIVGNGTNNHLSKWISANTIVDSLIYDDGVNVGISTNSPLERLDLNGAFNMRGMPSAPTDSNIGSGKIYFNTTTGKFRVHEDGAGGWHNLINTDVVTNVDYYNDVALAECDNTETIYWNNVSDSWQCQAINSNTLGGFVREGGNNFSNDMTVGTNSNHSLNFETNGSTRMSISPDGFVGIGTTPFSPFHSQSTLTAPTGSTHNGYFGTLVTPSSAHSGTYNSLTSEMTINNTSAVAQAYAANIRSFTTSAAAVNENAGLIVLNQRSGAGTTVSGKGISSSLQASQGMISNAVGVISDVRTTSSGSMGDVRGVSSIISTSVGNSMNDMIAYSASISSNGFGTNTATGLEVLIAGTQNPTTSYGVRIGNMVGVTKYAIHQSDATARNFFAGNVGIGTTNPAANLDVQGTVRIGTNGTNLSRVIVCPSVSFTNGALIPAGSAAIVASNASSCPGVVTGMTFNCSLDSENMSITSYIPMTANAGDQGNQQIRMRVLNPTAGAISTSALTAIFSCVGTRH